MTNDLDSVSGNITFNNKRHKDDAVTASNNSKTKTSRSRTSAIGVACGLIVASLSAPAVANATESQNDLSSVSSEQDNVDNSPMIPFTPKPNSEDLSPENATSSVDQAIAESTTEITPDMIPEGMTTSYASPESASPDSVRSDKFAGKVFTLMNAERRAVGAPALVWNQKIANVSQDWSNKLRAETADPNFDWNKIHRADGGGSLIPKGANRYGEIIAFNFSADQVVDWWMDSPDHRSAMLNAKHTDVGVGYVVPTSGPYKGWHLVVSNLAGYPKTTKAKAASPFSDLVAGQQFLTEMNWMHTQGISTGWTEANGKKTYRPFNSINRDAMAAFMYRLKGSPAFTPPKKSPFTDVSTSNMYYKEIAWLASEGISTGWTEGNGTKTYRPYEPVNRDAMAAFLYRLSGSPKFDTPKTSTFIDIAPNNQFKKEIAWTTASGIATGWNNSQGKPEFRPVQPVARDAMAAFMYRWAV